jgi:hypothetical protein
LWLALASRRNRAIAEELDPTISALEQAADQTEVLRLIEQLGGDEKLPN